MAFPPDFLRELAARNPIGEVASSYVNLKRRGKNLIGLCPFHNEKTPSHPKTCKDALKPPRSLYALR